MQKSGLMLFCNSSYTCTPTSSLQVHILMPVHTEILAIAKSLLKHEVNKLIQYSLSTLSTAALCSLLSFLPVFFPTQVPYLFIGSLLHSRLQAQALVSVKAQLRHPALEPVPKSHSLAHVACSSHSPSLADGLAPVA